METRLEIQKEDLLTNSHCIVYSPNKYRETEGSKGHWYSVLESGSDRGNQRPRIASVKNIDKGVD